MFARLDGYGWGVFSHRYRVSGKKYEYLKLCFSNLSQPLRRFVYRVLGDCGFHPKYRSNNHVWLYSEAETRKYLQIVGSSNDRLRRKAMI